MLLFKDVNIESIESYLESCRKKNFFKGDILISPKIANNHIFLLLEGNLTIHLDSIDNPPLDTIEPGECVGEMSLIEKKHPSAYVIASKNSVLFEINHDTIWSIMNASHGVAYNLLNILSGRLRRGNCILIDTMKIQQQSEHFASIDPLTGMRNRRWLNKMFKRELQRCRKANLPATLIMLDLDHFKLFNDQYGHLAGDQALLALACQLRENLRPTDLTARFGGEEFVILLPQTELAEAFSIAERLRKKIAEAGVLIKNKRHYNIITASFGIAQMKIGDSLDTLLSSADEAMYRAKKQGRNCVCQ